MVTEPARSRDLEEALERAFFHIKAGALGEALRWADRANRHVKDSPEVAELLGKLLFAAGDHSAALIHLERAARKAPSAALETAIIDGLFVLGRQAEALDRLGRSLGAFAVEPEDALAECARKHTLAPGSGLAGWMALRDDLSVWGEVGPAGAEDSIKICPGADVVTASLVPFQAGTVSGYRFCAPLPGAFAGAISVEFAGGRLAGSGMGFPPDFRLDGRAWADGAALKGWVRLGWAPALRPQVSVRDRFRTVAERVAEHSAPAGIGQQFDIPLPRLVFGNELAVDVRLPDGRVAPLPTSPALRRPPPVPVTLRGMTRMLLGGWPRRRACPPTAGVAVVIPVHSGREESANCLRSVLTTIAADTQVLVIDDASPDPDLSGDLRTLAALGRIVLLTNAVNLGFAASVNRALKLTAGRDVVILNADAEVFPGWLDRLAAIARGAPDIGVVTPLTNSGAIASYPGGAGAPCSSDEAAALDSLAAALTENRAVDAPTGVGFCLYVRADCLAEVGMLDSRCFGRGYGEENDFCMRAARLGWRRVIAPQVFVRHRHGRSFGDAAPALRERNTRLLNLRHPDYARLVDEFIELDPLRLARRRLDEARLRADGGPFRLLASLAAPGGVEKFVLDRCEAIEASGEIALVLRPDETAGKVRLTTPAMILDDLVYDIPTELDALVGWLAKLAPRCLELHHFLGHAPDLIEALLDIGCDATVYIHDYSWMCPRLTLLGGSGRYCGEPAVEDCETCIATHGSSLDPDLSVAGLRARSARWLAKARRIVMPTRDTADRMSRYFRLPGEATVIEGWESATPQMAAAPATAPGKVKVVIIGAIGDQKGYGVLLACVIDAAARQLPIEFVLLGFTEHDSELMAAGEVFISGRFDTAELDSMIRREAPHVALFASVTPETWSYSLTHALRAGLPVVAFDIGAIAERLRMSGALTELLPIDSEAAAVNNAILSIAGWQNSTQEAYSGLEFRQDTPIDDGRDAVGKTETRVGELMTEASIGLTATVQLLTLNKGLYRFSVQSATPTRPVDDSDVILPAVHVAVAPGTPAHHAEFMNGLRGEGSWLFDQTDVLIVKATVSGTSIMVTSYGARGLGSLSIDVERIDVRRQPTAQVAAENPVALAAPAPAPALEPVLIASPGPRFEDGRRVLAMQVKAHISMRGDVAFTNVEWAGDIEERLPVEAFSILPLEGLAPEDIEYRGLTAQGSETPWVSGGELCGERQRALPLSGFAVRLKGKGSQRFDCRCRGLFRSGAVIGPSTDSALLRSDSLRDYLIGIQVSIGELPEAIAAVIPEEDLSPHVVEPEPPAPIGPRFSVFRQEAN